MVYQASVLSVRVVTACVFTTYDTCFVSPGSGELLADTLAQLVGAIRENITISRAHVRAQYAVPSHVKSVADRE